MFFQKTQFVLPLLNALCSVVFSTGEYMVIEIKTRNSCAPTGDKKCTDYS
uniref:Uncharacterized protein n=1 Tax=Anguilla anguilla TaxID=7936 RepID=A0A0E9V804_ANGAN